jgi:hypothetical protein
VHGALNIHTGALLLFITDIWDQTTHQYFLTMIRSYWRGQTWGSRSKHRKMYG